MMSDHFCKSLAQGIVTFQRPGKAHGVRAVVWGRRGSLSRTLSTQRRKGAAASQKGRQSTTGPCEAPEGHTFLQGALHPTGHTNSPGHTQQCLCHAPPRAHVCSADRATSQKPEGHQDRATASRERGSCSQGRF